jgi:oligo-1,6-glucosidase
MRGTPYYYMGDEIGMTNIRFESINDYNDVDTRNKYTNLKKIRRRYTLLFRRAKASIRENGRTPMQWNNTENSGSQRECHG